MFQTVDLRLDRFSIVLITIIYVLECTVHGVHEARNSLPGIFAVYFLIYALAELLFSAFRSKEAK